MTAITTSFHIFGRNRFVSENYNSSQINSPFEAKTYKFLPKEVKEKKCKFITTHIFFKFTNVEILIELETG
jgi:hypothetical protein